MAKTLRLLTITNSSSSLPEAAQMRRTLKPMTTGQRNQTISDIPAGVVAQVFPLHGVGKYYGPLRNDRNARFYHGVFDGVPVEVIRLGEDSLTVLVDDSIDVPSLETRPGGGNASRGQTIRDRKRE